MTDKRLMNILRHHPISLSDLCKDFKVSKSQMKSDIHHLRSKGVAIQKNSEGVATTYFLPKTLPKEPEYSTEISHFGLMGDTHIGSKYAEPEALDMYYDEIDEAGIKHVIHAGDMVDGINVYLGQYNDLLPDSMNIEMQIDKAIKEYPQKQGLETLIISGNHDLRQFQRQGIDPVREVCKRRKDMTFIGQNYGRVKLKDDILLEVVHPSGGAPYSKDYRIRTYLRERPINTYPDILAMGHLHCSMFEDVQGTLSYLVGAFMGDTDYTRRKGLTTTVGGWNVDLNIDDGNIKKVTNTFVKY